MQIEVRGAGEISVASRLAEQISILDKMLSEARGQPTVISELWFKSAVMESTYYWELTLKFNGWNGTSWDEPALLELKPDQDSEASIYMRNVLSCMFDCDEVEHALGQEFGMGYIRPIRIKV